MNNPKVSIIILNWNGKDDTIECIESLEKISYQNYDIILVDNDSKGDDIKVLKEKFGDYIHLIKNDKNYGFAEGCNIGMRYALKKGTDYILLLNNDVVVDRWFLSELVKIAERKSDIGIVGPKIYHYNDKNRIWSAGVSINMWTCNIRLLGFGELDKGQFNNVMEVDGVVGCALLIKQKVISEVGLLDPNYFAYHEESDWCLRVKKSGHKIVYVPSAKLWHKVSSSTGGGHSSYNNPFKAYQKGRNSLLLMKKNAELKHWLIFPFFAFVNLIRAIFRETLRGNTKAIIVLIEGIFSNFKRRK